MLIIVTCNATELYNAHKYMYVRYVERLLFSMPIHKSLSAVERKLNDLSIRVVSSVVQSKRFERGRKLSFRGKLEIPVGTTLIRGCTFLWNSALRSVAGIYQRFYAKTRKTGKKNARDLVSQHSIRDIPHLYVIFRAANGVKLHVIDSFGKHRIFTYPRV